MTIVHIVAFKSTAPPSAQQALISSFEALSQQCLHPKTGKPYITSLKCGRQNSPEGMTKGLELIFVLEFENLEDRDYYLDHDPAHVDFKNRVPDEFKVVDAAVLDFEVGKWHSAVMTVVHIVGIKSLADASAQSTLISSFEALAEKCVNPKTGNPLISSFRCGKQNSPEGMTKGLEMIFVLEFENIEDRDYYLDHPAHVEFKNRAPDFDVVDVGILDFEVGQWEI